MMSLTVLSRVIIDKSPEVIKPLLYLAVNESQTWPVYIEEAAKLVHVGFLDAILNQVSSHIVKKMQKWG